MFTVGTVALSTPLPVELISFEAKQKASIVELTWAMATELNSDFFTIERSSDGVNFEFVMQVKSVGNTNEESHYITFDLDPEPGRTYYRLTQTDLDGTFERLAVSRVDISGGVESFNIRMFPNPSRDGNFTLVLPETSNGARVDVIDQMGRVIQSEIHASKMKSFDVTAASNQLPVFTLFVLPGEIASRR